MRTKRCGFALSETMISLALVAVLGMLVVSSSGANAVVSAQSAARVHAARLALELSDWAYRGGLRAFGMAADQAFVEVSSSVACHAGECDAEQGARHYVFRWQARLRHAIPGVRAVLCSDHAPASDSATSDWTCDPAGKQAVLKLGWPSHPADSGFRPTLVVALGSAD